MPGLWQFLEGRQGWGRRRKLDTYTHVGVDGDGLAYFLGREMCGNTSITYGEFVEAYLTQLEEATQKVTVFLDGARTRRKNGTRRERREVQLRPGRGNTADPMLRSHFAAAVASTPGVDLVVLASDADAEMVMPEFGVDVILGQDSDFLIYPALQAYIPLASIRMKSKGMEGMEHSGGDTAAVLGFGEGNALALPVFASLVGNDYVNMERLHARFSSGGGSTSDKHAQKQKRRGKGGRGRGRGRGMRSVDVIHGVLGVLAMNKGWKKGMRTAQALHESGDLTPDAAVAHLCEPLRTRISSVSATLYARFVDSVCGYLVGCGPDLSLVVVGEPEREISVSILPRTLADVATTGGIWVPPVLLDHTWDAEPLLCALRKIYVAAMRAVGSAVDDDVRVWCSTGRRTYESIALFGGGASPSSSDSSSDGDEERVEEAWASNPDGGSIPDGGSSPDEGEEWLEVGGRLDEWIADLWAKVSRITPRSPLSTSSTACMEEEAR